MYECFHCGKRAVIWNGDFSFEDYDMEGDGVIHILTCSECGAEIVYYCGEREDETDARA